MHERNAMRRVSTFLALGAALLPQVAEAAKCHADLLVLGIDYNALTEQEKLAAGAAVAQKIALETGEQSSNVLSKLFAGNYNANWSPVKNRPQANVFLASLLRECPAPAMVLGALRGPQLQESVTQALTDTLASSRAKIGAVKIIGASVVPESSSGSPEMVGAPTGEQAGLRATGGSGGGGGGSTIGVLVLIIGIACLGVLFVPKLLKKFNNGGYGQGNDSDQEYPFDGH
mmetsp:Transcript_96175/g.277714  ORF Transcript_96175/g.277714 Transcript_96175/m.277714 type:complete len:230 (-) Transcript_96175:114-803(-)